MHRNCYHDYGYIFIVFLSMTPKDTNKHERAVITLFIAVIVLCILSSIVRYAIQKDYTLFGKIECNPITSNCFTETCTDGDVRCMEYSEDGVNSYFQLAYFTAHQAKDCKTSDCIMDLCEERGCYVFECTEENLGMLETENSCDEL
jgi:hypothetical protein